MVDIIINFIVDFVAILCEMAPYLLLGFLFAGLLYAFLPQRVIRRYFNGSPFASSARAALLGVPLPLCSCGVIPTGMALYKNGASKGSTISFLISTPQTGIDSILATFSMMGLPFAIVRPLTAFVTGVLGGWIGGSVKDDVAKDDAQSSCKDSSCHEDCNEDCCHDEDCCCDDDCCCDEGCSCGGSNMIEGAEVPKSFVGKLALSVRYGFYEFLGDIAKWLVVGLVVAALISALVPKDFIAGLNLPVWLQMLAMLIVAIPMYVCATGSIPIAAMFIAIGINPGAAFVFLMAGPATNAATITVLDKVLGRKSLIIYLLSIITGALVAGLLIAYLMPAQWFEMFDSITCNDCLTAEKLGVLPIACGVILALLIVVAFVGKRIESHKIHTETDSLKHDDLIVSEILVEGMMCSHCKANVENASLGVEGVEKAVADLAKGSVIVSGKAFDINDVKNSISKAGYKIKE